MKNITHQNNIVIYQQSVSEWLHGIHPLPRFIGGLFACAAAALYLPLLFLALTGNWMNVLNMWLENSICVAVLMIQNVIGNKIGRTLALGVILAVIFDCYIVNLTARTWTLGEWRFWWQNFFFTTIAFPLNAYLFLKYKKAAEL